MEVDQFVDKYPRLFHMAEAGTWPSIRDRGLLSATAALDLLCIEGDDRIAYESAQRTQAMELSPGQASPIVLRHQRAMPPDRLAVALVDGTRPEQWYRLINGRVFFWADEARLHRMLAARDHRRRAYDVLTLDSRRLVERHRERLWLCHMHSGNTRPAAQPRGIDTFQRIHAFPPFKPVVEVAFDYSLPDVETYVVDVRRMQEKQALAPRARVPMAC